MRVLGIDPGLRNMGWGIVDVSGNKLSHIANGVCQSQGNDLATRLLSLFNQMETILEQWQPTHGLRRYFLVIQMRWIGYLLFQFES